MLLIFDRDCIDFTHFFGIMDILTILIHINNKHGIYLHSFLSSIYIIKHRSYNFRHISFSPPWLNLFIYFNIFSSAFKYAELLC